MYLPLGTYFETFCKTSKELIRKWIIQLRKMFCWACYSRSIKKWWGMCKSRGTSVTVNMTGWTFRILSFWEEWGRHSTTTAWTPGEQISDRSGIYFSGSQGDFPGRERGSRRAVWFPNHNLLKRSSSLSLCVQCQARVAEGQHGWQRIPQLVQMHNKAYR